MAEDRGGSNRVLLISRDRLRFRRRPQHSDSIRPVSTHLAPWQSPSLNATRYDVAICLGPHIRLATFVCMKLVRARRKLAFWQILTNLPRPLADKLSHGWEHWQGDSEILPETRTITETF